MTTIYVSLADGSPVTVAHWAKRSEQTGSSLTERPVVVRTADLDRWLPLVSQGLQDSWTALSVGALWSEIVRGMIEQFESALSLGGLAAHLDADTCEHSAEEAVAAQQARNAGLIALLDEWMADESGYDERVWPTVKQAIQENRLSYRSRFCDEGGA